MRYLLYGLGISNYSIKKHYDLEKINYEIYTDNDSTEANLDYDLIIKSPGISNDTKLMKIVDKTKVITDLELFYSFRKDLNLIVITGSNGKTTVTSLIGKILKDYSYDVCGNIGTPIFEFIETKSAGLVVEASSYMLEYIKDFKPNVFVILNIENHHLEHHKTFRNYYECKLKPLKNMKKNDIVIYNYDDEFLKDELKKYNVLKYTFSMKNNNADCYYENSTIYYKQDEFMKTNKLKVIGEHNIKNIMASILAVKGLSLNIENELVKNRINTFEPLSHRLEKFYEVDETVFINDSKSTNPYSTIEAIKSVKDKYQNKLINLIMGGKLETFNYSCLKIYLPYINEIFLFGECAEKIKNELDINNQLFPNLEALINENNFNDSVVLFSPGAPSFDQFDNFEKRGEHFKELIIDKYKKQYI